jgi:hypothetical protein
MAGVAGGIRWSGGSTHCWPGRVKVGGPPGRAGDGQAENRQDPGGGDPPALAGADDGAGELPGARQLVGPGPAEPQGAAGGDQVGDGGQGGDLREGQLA